MTWLRTPNGGYVDPLEVIAALPDSRIPNGSLALLQNGREIAIDDTPDRVWHAVMDARREA